MSFFQFLFVVFAVPSERLGLQGGIRCRSADVNGISSEVQRTEDEKVCRLWLPQTY